MIDICNIPNGDWPADPVWSGDATLLDSWEWERLSLRQRISRIKAMQSAGTLDEYAKLLGRLTGNTFPADLIFVASEEVRFYQPAESANRDAWFE